MHLIDKREKTMSLEEKVRLEMARSVLAVLGNNLRDRNSTFNLRKDSSRAMKIADCLMKRFNVEFKDQKELKIFWPEDDVLWEGKNSEKIHDTQEPVDVEIKKEEPKPSSKKNKNSEEKIDDEPQDK